MSSPVNVTKFSQAAPSPLTSVTPIVHHTANESSTFHTQLREASARKQSKPQTDSSGTDAKSKPAASAQPATKPAGKPAKAAGKSSGKSAAGSGTNAKSHRTESEQDDPSTVDSQSPGDTTQLTDPTSAAALVTETAAAEVVAEAQTKQAAAHKNADGAAAALLLGATVVPQAGPLGRLAKAAAGGNQAASTTTEVVPLDGGSSHDSALQKAESENAASASENEAAAQRTAASIPSRATSAEKQATPSTGIDSDELVLSAPSQSGSAPAANVQSAADITSDIADAVASIAAAFGANESGDPKLTADPTTIAVSTSAATGAVAAQLAHAAGSRAVAPALASQAQSAVPQFAAANHSQIVTGVQTQLLPHGGTMNIRLDPPELGVLQVTVTVHNGVVNATFQTANDDATRMLSHSLGQLKTALESQGMSVDKIRVQQSPRDQNASTGGDRQPSAQDQQQSRQEQQRKQMLQQMWAKVAGLSDPMDLVA